MIFSVVCCPVFGINVSNHSFHILAMALGCREEFVVGCEPYFLTKQKG